MELTMGRQASASRKIDPIFIWVLIAVAAFIVLPTYRIEYGLFEATSDELWDSYVWMSRGIGWLWVAAPLLLLARPLTIPPRSARGRHLFDAALAGVIALGVLFSAWWVNEGLGYSSVILFIALGMVAKHALSRLIWMGGDRFVIGAILTIVVLVALFMVFPTLAIFKSLNLEILQRAVIRQIILNSLLVATVVGLTATFVGLVCAIYTTRIGVRTVFIGRFISILPMVTPPFVVGLGATLMLGRSGYVTNWLAHTFGFTHTNWLYGFNGIWIAQVLAFAPMSFMILDGAIKTISPSVEEASYTLRAGRWQTFWYVFLPLLRPALANSFLIVFVQSLADFSNPLVLGGSFDVLATQIYFYIAGSQLNYGAASTLGVVLLLFSLGVFVIQYIWIGQRSYVTVSGKSYRGEVQGLPKALERFVIVFLSIWAIFNFVLYGSIVYGGFTVNWGVDYTLTLANYKTLFGGSWNSGAWPSLLTTLTYACVAAPLTAALGLIIAYIIARQTFWGKRALEFSTMLCFAVPGTVAGVSYLFAFNMAPLFLTSTAAIVVISMVMRNVPIAIRAGITGLGQLDKSLDEASLSLRAGSLRTVVYVLMPLLRPAIFTSLVFSFVHAMTTFSSIVFLVTADTRVATAYMLNRLEDGEYGTTNAYGTLLIFVMMFVIFLFDWLVGEERTSRSKAKKTV